MGSTQMEEDNYEDLSNEKELVEKIENFKQQVINLENVLKPFCESNIYPELTIEQKVEYDIFHSYTLTSIYWMYLKTLGQDPFQHPVKGEVERVQEYGSQFTKIKHRKKVPQIDKAAAKRFIQRGIGKIPAPSGKRIKFDDNGDAIESQVVNNDETENANQSECSEEEVIDE